MGAAPYHRKTAMAEHRAFPPSPRRRALARQAGLHAASPVVVAATAAAAALIATAVVARVLSHRLATAIAAACSGDAVLAPGALAEAVLATALPAAGAAALAATLAHLAQTRALWLPRRRIADAPAIEAGALPRTRRAALDLAGAALLGGVAFAWLWLSAPRLAVLVAVDPVASPAAPSPLLLGGVALIANAAAALVIAWAGFGVVDALVRHAGLARVLAMTPAEKREDDRVAGADPRWRARRNAIQRGLRPAEAIAGASLLLLGDDAAIAVAWDPVRRPIPVRTATGRAARAAQLLGLARRHRIPVHRDPALVAALVDGEGPIPETHWPRLAEIVAATRGPRRAP